ncbi:hypothetical protein [Rathayibacter sp. VKM Ac-2760]|uniref:hypothetical protein n=1 Tax=Rathayibacter sp. VKM Ac-2760 TaxID=2609253 RepID=UPI0013174D17|nr:hypothetical protein [Rathayibacter sp. VKM Ac-2760]QHC60413.1 hypothetical protein GSU72_19040 [Rathayibacter sp. VKM Ac-2760]
MQTLLPADDAQPWAVTGGVGPDEDVTIAIDRGPDIARCSVRTLTRPRIRLGPRGSVHGVATDAVAIAALAAGCLLLDVVPAGLPHDELVAAMKDADARSLALARDRAAWSVTALPLDGIDYALFTRSIPEGTLAHADLGRTTIAMWSRGPLFDGPFRLADIDPSEHLPGR